jgi:catechol 2,3-dioxygenase-like lactoylglutathione lyase family enzyme
MLGSKDSGATLPTGDLQRARDFYEQKLGLEPIRTEGESVLYRSGATAMLVYSSAYAGTNQATAAMWAVGDDFDAIVDELRGKGVTFEHYDDLPDTTREGDIHNLGGELRGVWFKDPDGNILSIIDESP